MERPFRPLQSSGLMYSFPHVIMQNELHFCSMRVSNLVRLIINRRVSFDPQQSINLRLQLVSRNLVSRTESKHFYGAVDAHFKFVPVISILHKRFLRISAAGET